ncbi:hypothetical protein [Mycoplasmopsis verecunda]|uniref:YobI-like P-loop NTPase domain-containing protein n=1 Tax=Mycoplasmopsis verecunda TaxID=171291 RepID=A0A1T4LVJ6_9BACT|nr:hypothetical protein [Mycoplasmopsis verecunda]WPB54526.1 hypothetical protein SAM46_03575 [Mycoplasmopsis verecunda]SJZ58656.1 hypothetical protein SAMN02745154_00551 [Mycoplasmopsis verecunda]
MNNIIKFIPLKLKKNYDKNNISEFILTFFNLHKLIYEYYHNTFCDIHNDDSIKNIGFIATYGKGKSTFISWLYTYKNIIENSNSALDIELKKFIDIEDDNINKSAVFDYYNMMEHIISSHINRNIMEYFDGKIQNITLIDFESCHCSQNNSNNIKYSEIALNFINLAKLFYTNYKQNLNSYSLPISISIGDYDLDGNKDISTNFIEEKIISKLESCISDKDIQRHQVPLKSTTRHSKFISLLFVISLFCTLIFGTTLITLKLFNYPVDIFVDKVQKISINGQTINISDDVNTYWWHISLILHIGFLISIVFLSFVICWKSYFWIRNKSYSKIKFDSLQIMGTNIQASDEKQGFSENKKYIYKLISLICNVYDKKHPNKALIFEDLDRLHNKDIFTSLHDLNSEINQMIKNNFTNHNQSNAIQFIYVTSDSIFTDVDDKTKFFDAIINYDNDYLNNKLSNSQIQQVILDKFNISNIDNIYTSKSVDVLTLNLFQSFINHISTKISNYRTYVLFKEYLDEEFTNNQSYINYIDDLKNWNLAFYYFDIYNKENKDYVSFLIDFMRLYNVYIRTFFASDYNKFQLEASYLNYSNQNLNSLFSGIKKYLIDKLLQQTNNDFKWVYRYTKIINILETCCTMNHLLQIDNDLPKNIIDIVVNNTIDINSSEIDVEFKYFFNNQSNESNQYLWKYNTQDIEDIYNIDLMFSLGIWQGNDFKKAYLNNQRELTLRISNKLIPYSEDFYNLQTISLNFLKLLLISIEENNNLQSVRAYLNEGTREVNLLNKVLNIVN